MSTEQNEANYRDHGYAGDGGLCDGQGPVRIIISGFDLGLTVRRSCEARPFSGK